LPSAGGSQPQISAPLSSGSTQPMDATSASAGLVTSPSPVPPPPSCTLHRVPNGLWAANTLPALLDLAKRVAPPSAPAPAYCAVGNPLSMGDALDHLAGYCVVVVPYRLLQLHLAACAQDVATLEAQVRLLQEHANRQANPPSSSGADTQEPDWDANANTSQDPQADADPADAEADWFHQSDPNSNPPIRMPYPHLSLLRFSRATTKPLLPQPLPLFSRTPPPTPTW
ncbi:MAG: hypothetical protein FD142_3172, partial [bacterium]